VGGRGVWLLLVLDLLVFRSSLANKEAARSRSVGVVSHVFLSLNLAREKGNCGSYASTSVPHPWQDPALAGPAPSIPTLSCCNQLHVCYYLKALDVLGMLSRCLTAWRALQQDTYAGCAASPPYSMAEGRPSTRSTNSSGGPLLPSAGARRVDVPPSGSSSVPRLALVVLRRNGEHPEVLPL
jgi:hypothetical protein